MSNQGSLSPGDAQTSSEDLRPGLPSLMSGADRRDTTSTMSSGNPIPTGIWTFEIHGNCPRCHHHHKAAIMKIKVDEDPTRASEIRCERCTEKWLAIGGRNTTQLSLLSTLSAETTDRDQDELDFRYTLISIVRSATAIASPTLASVPESSSRVPSRGNSVRSPSHGANQGDSQNFKGSASKRDPKSAADTSCGPAVNPSTAPHHSIGRTKSSNRIKLSKKTFRALKCKLKKALPHIRNMDFSKYIRGSKSDKKSAKAVGKQAVVDPPNDDDQKLSFKDVKHIDVSPDNKQMSKALKEANDVCTPAKSKEEAIEEIKNSDKDMIKNMTPEERVRWFRQQVTTFKCRCSRRCSCRRRHSTSSIMIDRSTQVRLSPELHRHHSADFLLGLGSHFDLFPPGTMFPYDRDLSITSATRTSEADTAVEGQPAASGARNSYVDTVRHQRHRSLSPRPASLVNSRHSLQLRQQGLVPRVSMDSMIAGSGIRSTSRRRGNDRRSAASFAPITIPPLTDSPEAPQQDHTTIDQDGASTPTQTQPAASTPPVNGYLTDDERNRESDTTPPASSSRS